VELTQVITAVGLGLMDVTRPIQSVGIYWDGVNAIVKVQDFGLMDGVELLVEATKNVMMVIVNGNLEGALSAIGHKSNVIAAAASSGPIIVVQMVIAILAKYATKLEVVMSMVSVLINQQEVQRPAQLHDQRVAQQHHQQLAQHQHQQNPQARAQRPLKEVAKLMSQHRKSCQMAE